MAYQQARDKIIQAYFRDEIKPLDAKFCFCGTLCDNKSEWHDPPMHKPLLEYTGEQFRQMELALWLPFGVSNILSSHPNYEEFLFLGMCAALDVLKEIHRSRGEDVDGVEVFKKREIINHSI